MLLRRIVYILLLWTMLGISLPLSVESAAEYPRTYEMYMDLGKRSMDHRDFNQAVTYFKLAHLSYPTAREPGQYLNLAKRLADKRVELIHYSADRQSPVVEEDPYIPTYFYDDRPHEMGQFAKKREEIINDTLDVFEQEVMTRYIAKRKDERTYIKVPRKWLEDEQKAIDKPRAQRDKISLPSKRAIDMVVKGQESFNEDLEDVKHIIREDDQVKKTAVSLAPSDKRETASEKEETDTEIVLARKETSIIDFQKTIYLNDDLWLTQPKTVIRVPFDSSIILEGSNIERFLMISPGFIELKQNGRNQVEVFGIKRGSTLLHVWDDRGRWTFRMEVIFPIQLAAVEIKEQQMLETAAPFKFSYDVDWSAFYSGQSLPNVKRENLTLIQRLGLEGETPYGDVDSSMAFNKFDETTELTNYSVGLSDGKIGNFKDFNIRGFDTAASFSPLSLPGKYIRGFYFNSKAFDQKIKYEYLYGRDRATFGFLSPGLIDDMNSFYQGGRLTLFPDKDNRLSFNFARGSGIDREVFLKEKVYSVEGQAKIKNVRLLGEVGYDEDKFAETAAIVYNKDKFHLRVDARDLDEEYATITSFPSNRGEVGGSVDMNWDLERFSVSSFVDVYKDRFLPNVDNPDKLNLDLTTSVEVPLAHNDKVRSSVYYVNTPGELSPRETWRFNTVYSKRFKLWAKEVNAFVGTTYQRSRFDFAPASEFDRYSFTTGFSYPLIRNLNYYMNYEYSWVDEKLTGDTLQPNVFNTGLNYHKKLSEAWTGNINFSYRNEENTEGINSFLAGEDSITGSVGAVYRPTPDFEFFVDGRMRNVWSERINSTSFNEVDVRGGIRTAWDTPFVWNPEGIIEGIVYKDLNGNQKQDELEAGLPEITVNVGHEKVVTDDKGRFTSKVKAKKVSIGVELDSVPQGFIFSTPMLVDVAIAQKSVNHVEFGLTTQSGIYGVVYYDVNSNGRPDPDDEFIARTKLVMDGQETVYSDFEGTYFFKNVLPGTHTVRIDVNSLPIEYLPKIKIENEVEVTEGTTYVFHVPVSRK
ncbi:MAG: hypothetical protein H6755_06210 [Candidatus Omnitrophica bacterium]|nr:hypothetical protein [Candidatus Omnitrophota bacterium]